MTGLYFWAAISVSLFIGGIIGAIAMGIASTAKDADEYDACQPGPGDDGSLWPRNPGM